MTSDSRVIKRKELIDACRNLTEENVRTKSLNFGLNFELIDVCCNLTKENVRTKTLNFGRGICFMISIF